MATKENMTSQRGMLKSIQSRVNTLASILSHRCVWSLGGVVYHYVLFIFWWSDVQMRSLTLAFLRPVPHHQQSHPANQPAEKTGLSHPGLCDRHLHHPPTALRFALKAASGRHLERLMCPFAAWRPWRDWGGAGGWGWIRSAGSWWSSLFRNNFSQGEPLNFSRPSSSNGVVGFIQKGISIKI